MPLQCTPFVLRRNLRNKKKKNENESDVLHAFFLPSSMIEKRENNFPGRFCSSGKCFILEEVSKMELTHSSFISEISVRGKI